MRWKGRETSDNFEDRRGKPSVAAVGGGGIVILIIGAIITLMNGGDVGQVVQQVAQQAQQQAAQGGGAEGGNEELIAEQAELEEFSRVVLRDTEVVWNRLLPEQLGKQYREPKLVVFAGSVNSACGRAGASVGPFYCPGDSMVYIDLTFFDELQTKFRAPGDFACAYVIAHEVGHHIQNLLGLSMQVQRAQAQMSDAEGNRLSVRLELQADFLAGVWAHHADEMMNILERGDIDEALRAANQIGDDTLQRQATGRVVPDAFTHGTSEQRIRWFRKGYSSGNLDDMDLLFDLDYDQL